MIDDLLTEKRLQGVYPDLVERWRAVRSEMWDRFQMQIRVTEGIRSFADQLKDWSVGRQKNDTGKWQIVEPHKIVTHAPPGLSAHQYGLALDSAFMGDDPFLARMDAGKAGSLWYEYGQICQAHLLTWGGSWEAEKMDRPHCEKLYGYSIHDIQCFYEAGGLAKVWDKCNLKVGEKS